MHGLARAGLGLKQPLGCFGNNLSVRKNVFDKIGGYDKINFSVTEDLALFQAVYNSGSKIRYVCSYSSTVDTLPCKNIKEYFMQHHRWVIGGLGLGWRAFIFVLSSAAFWTGIVAGIIFHNYPLALACFLIRIAGDSSLLLPAINAMRRYGLFIWIIPSIIFFIVMELIAPFLLLNKKIVWKGQEFKI
jgi:cellulose synthase/poly-beta-1,6-N-acetylglucosamine synthase-like glycosyltransferase